MRQPLISSDRLEIAGFFLGRFISGCAKETPEILSSQTNIFLGKLPLLKPLDWPGIRWRSQSKSLKLADPRGEMGSNIDDQQRSRFRNMAMDQYLLIPFLGEWTSIYQLFWCSPGVQGFDTLPYWYWPRKKGVILCNICHKYVLHTATSWDIRDEVNNHWGHSVQSWCCGQLTLSAAKQFKRPFHLTPSNGGGFRPRCLNASCRFPENLKSRLSNISLEK